MKRPNSVRTVASLAALAGLSLSAHAAITGQWDFDTDLSARIGLPIGIIEGGGGPVEAATAFGSTTSFGIPGINGSVAKVMRFPKSLNTSGGYDVPTGASPNGSPDAFQVNQYTIIMDVLFPASSSGKERALIDTDFTGAPEFSVYANDGIGANGVGSGVLDPNTWHRVIFAVDTSANPPAVDKFVDGLKVGTQVVGSLDGRFSLDAGHFYLFNDERTSFDPETGAENYLGQTELGYINSLQIRDEKISDGLALALGGPSADGILTGPPPNPYIASVSPSPDTVRIVERSTVPPRPEVKAVIEDGTAVVVDSTVKLTFDGVAVVPTITRQGTTTTVSYTPPNFLPALSKHTVAVDFQDNSTPPNSLGTSWQFAVGPYLSLPADSAAALGSGTDPGFTVRTVQAPVDALVANSYSRALQQLNGTLKDQAGKLIPNEAIAGPNADGSYPVDVINFSDTGDTYGNFDGDTQFPGIPGTGDHTTLFATEVTGYLDLPAGVYNIGVSVSVDRVDVNDDDSFVLFAGSNPRDFFSPVIGGFANRVGGFAARFNNNVFTVVAPAAGLYPIRLVHFQQTRRTSLELFTVNAAGENVLINDPNNPDSIKAYRVSPAKKANAPFVAEAAPRPGASGVESSAPISILIDDQATALNAATVKLTLNGAVVSPNKVKSGKRTTISFSPAPNRSTITNQVVLTYSDNAVPANTFTDSWTFTIVAGTGELNVVKGQWDFDAGDLRATIGAPLEYFDGPTGKTAAGTKFGTASSLGLPLLDGKDVKVMEVPGADDNDLGYIMRHGIAPNGGGSKVNKYTIVMDLFLDTVDTGAGAASLIQVDDLTNRNDGDIFWQGSNFGQGGGGYNGTGAFTLGAWHRVSWAVDLTTVPATITKFLDGIKQDDWHPSDALDGRRGLQAYAILFGDGDHDERRRMWVNSIQVREGKLADSQLALLGKPSAGGIPVALPDPGVTGQWDFERGNLSATVGTALEYFDGPTGKTAAGTKFGTASSFGLPSLGGEDVKVMEVPGADDNDLGYIMRHGIAPNGGGSKVNKYTIVMDLFLDTVDTGAGAASLIQVDDLTNRNDGDIFWQGSNFGQGGGGYNGTGAFTLGAWHRVSWAVDLTTVPATITKFVDGIKQDDWHPSDTLDGRRGLQAYAILFGDGDHDERRRMWVNSIQVRDGKLSDEQLVLLGGPSPAGVPLVLAKPGVSGQWDFDRGNLAATIGSPLEYFDGPAGKTAAGTKFGTASSLGVPLLNGQDVKVMEVPGADDNDLGYIMRHGIAPNGGGSKVNKYTIVMDLFLDTVDTGAGAASLIQVDDLTNRNDGDIFWQGSNFGQGGGGYNGTGAFTLGAWHRVSWAVDLTTVPATITKFVDGIKQDDWHPSDTLDGRRGLQAYAILFGDGDHDERRRMWVNSIQVREGKLTDAQLALLGGPSATGVPVVVPDVGVAGQWDFDRGNLAATIGAPLEYFDGSAGKSATGTKFGTASSLGLPGIEGQDVKVIEVPGADDNDIGYIMRHGIAPNGGGSKVNKYTIIMDLFLDTVDTGAGAASLIQVDDLTNRNDGDIFWQGSNFGQGGGGYNGTGAFTLGKWHRVSWGVDLTTVPATITKFVDGIKQDDWHPSDTLDGRRGLQAYAILFGDGDHDERRRIWANSIQIRDRKLTDEEFINLGGPAAGGIPLVIAAAPPVPAILTARLAGGVVTISWPAALTGFTLEGSDDLSAGSWSAVAGVANNSVAVSPTAAHKFYRLRK